MPSLQDPAPPGGFYLTHELHNFTWAIIIQHGNPKVGASRSASFQLPHCLSEKVYQVVRAHVPICVLFSHAIRRDVLLGPGAWGC